VLIYSANGELADALVERIRTMMKEVEVGDEYQGKVVKTTTFGAFIELSKGTDGLLHISNVSPGNRVETVEEVLSKGDEITCASSRWTASAAASACVAPTTRRSPASPSRSSPR
jgi:polyribonucleotide nucleotidyltransferase